MANDPSSAYGGGFLVDVGAPYSFSDVQLGNSGDEPLFVDGVDLIDPRGISIVGIRIGTVRTRDYPSGANGFPPASFHFPMAAPTDVPIPPKGAFDQPHMLLVIGLSAQRPGISSATGFSIAYHTASGDRFTQTIRYSIAFCAPKAHWEGQPFKDRCLAPPVSPPST